MVRTLSIAFLSLFVSTTATVAADEPDLTLLTKVLGVEPEIVAPSPVPGLYEVVIGAQLLYVNEDGRFAINGSVIDIADGRDITEPRRSEIRAGLVNRVGEDNMVIFEPEQGEGEHTVTVFTDIDCGYCRKLHAEIDSYNRAGVRVRYLFFPRTGLNTPSYDKAVTVWCSEDRLDAMTRAKGGENLAQLACANPVGDHYQLGTDIGVRGTPAIVLDDGTMVPGYVPAERLKQMLEAG